MALDPVFQTSQVTLYQGNCLHVLKQLPDESIDCVVTSPPYYGLRSYLDSGNLDKTFELGSEPTLRGYIDNLVSVFTEVHRVLRRSGSVWLNLGDSYAQNRWGKDEAPPPTNTGNKKAVSKSRGLTEFKPKDLTIFGIDGGVA